MHTEHLILKALRFVRKSELHVTYAVRISDGMKKISFMVLGYNKYSFHSYKSIRSGCVTIIFLAFWHDLFLNIDN